MAKILQCTKNSGCFHKKERICTKLRLHNTFMCNICVSFYIKKFYIIYKICQFDLILSTGFLEWIQSQFV